MVRESDLSTLATAILDANLPDGYSPVPGFLGYQPHLQPGKE